METRKETSGVGQSVAGQSVAGQALMGQALTAAGRPPTSQSCLCDSDDFGRAHRLYGRLVFHQAYLLVGHYEDAEDIKQETFLRAYRNRVSFRREATLQTWLLTICRNLCKDYLRARSRYGVCCERVGRLIGSGIDRHSDPFSAYEIAEKRQTLRGALGALLPAQQRLLQWRYVEDRDYEEIGALLGCTPSAAKMRLFRAREQLRAAWERKR